MMNRAKFLQNGNCGYVLKPDYGNCYTLQSSDEKHDFGKVKYLQEIQIKNLSNYSGFGVINQTNIWLSFAKCYQQTSRRHH